MLVRLLDSVILIDHFNSVQQASEFLLALNPEETAISVISYAEILTGLDEDGVKKARPLLHSFKMLEIDVAVAEKAAKLRQKHGWKLPDAFQAARARILLAAANSRRLGTTINALLSFILRSLSRGTSAA